MRGNSVDIAGKGDFLILTLRGQFDATSVPELEARTKTLVEKERKSTVIDVQGADFIGLSVISFLVGLAGMLVREGKEVKMCGVPDWLREVLEKTRVSKYVKFYDDQFGALLSFGPGKWDGIGVYERRSGTDRRKRGSPLKGAERRKKERRESRRARRREKIWRKEEGRWDLEYWQLLL